MADEQETPTPEAMESEDFDWNKFFLEDDEAPVTAGVTEATAPPPPPEDAEDEDVAGLQKQVEELQKIVAKTAQTTDQIEHQNRLSTAMQAWKAQASPAELSMGDVLAEAKDLDDLKARSALIKRVTSEQDSLRAQIRKEVELKMQKDFGLPVTPTFQPIPEAEKVEALLKEEDLSIAAGAMLKGMFNS